MIKSVIIEPLVLQKKIIVIFKETQKFAIMYMNHRRMRIASSTLHKDANPLTIKISHVIIKDTHISLIMAEWWKFVTTWCILLCLNEYIIFRLCNSVSKRLDKNRRIEYEKNLRKTN